jgi:hypothetical protein
MSRYTKILDGTNILNISEETLYSYYSYVRMDGSWVIMRANADMTEIRYASGSSDVDTAWTARATQIYKKANEFTY